MNRISSRPINKHNLHHINIKSYDCRFLPYNTPIYTILMHNKTLNKNIKTYHDKNETNKFHFKDTLYFTIPMNIEGSKKNEIETNNQNVVASFLCEYQANTIKKEIEQSFNEKNKKTNLTLISLTLKDLSYHAYIMKLPLIVVLNSFCNLDKDVSAEENIPQYSIFYTTRYLQIENDYPY